MIYINEYSETAYWIGHYPDGEGSEFDKKQVDDYFKSKGKLAPCETDHPHDGTLHEFYNENF